MKTQADPAPAAVLDFDTGVDTPRRSELVVATMEGTLGEGRCLVRLPAGDEEHVVAARSLVPLDAEDQGRQLALSFEGGDPARPIVLGVIARTEHTLQEDTKRGTLALDADTLLFTGRKELTLRCGKASVTLREDGKVVVRGTHLLSRSSGPVRLKGGSVSIN